jgi:hypothetical protein
MTITGRQYSHESHHVSLLTLLALGAPGVRADKAG